MRMRILSATAAMSAIMVAASPVAAAPQMPVCAPVAVIHDTLAGVGEHPVWRGQVNGLTLVVYSRADGITWSAVLIGDAGVACIVMTGTRSETIDSAPQLGRRA
mgnify:FL=1